MAAVHQLLGPVSYCAAVVERPVSVVARVLLVLFAVRIGVVGHSEMSISIEYD